MTTWVPPIVATVGEAIAIAPIVSVHVGEGKVTVEAGCAFAGVALERDMRFATTTQSATDAYEVARRRARALRVRSRVEYRLPAKNTVTLTLLMPASGPC